MTSKSQKLRVWFVDDVPSRLEEFKTRHGKEFDLTTFTSPDKVLRAFQGGDRPDVILCDIYFFGEKGPEIEQKVSEVAESSNQLAIKYSAESHVAGIDLIENLRCNGLTTIPIYAHTSKGPYLLQGAGFERLSNADVLWLFKDRCSPEVERQIIYKDVREFRERFGWKAKTKEYFWWFMSALIGAIFGGVVSWFLNRGLDAWWPAK